MRRTNKISNKMIDVTQEENKKISIFIYSIWS